MNRSTEIMRNAGRVSWTLLAVTWLGLGHAQAQSTSVTTCGQELNTSGPYHLTGNLGPCVGDGVRITANDVHLTLAGFTLSGVSSLASCDLVNPQTGINVMGTPSGVRINGGTVTGFVDGIVLGAANSRASAMTVTDNCVFGMVVSGAGQVIDTNVCDGKR